MLDLHREQVSELFDPDLMGALPDLFIPDATVKDWQAVLNLVTVSGWRWQFEIGTPEQPLRTAARIFARDRCAERLARTQSARDLQALRETEVSFDVDFRELQEQQGVDTLCAFLGDREQTGQAGADETEGRKPRAPAVLDRDPALGKVTPR